MKVRERLEHIIVGTLLDPSGQKYWDNCKCQVTDDMFSNETDRRIFRLIREMHDKGKDCNVYSIFEEYGESVMDILNDMVTLSTDYAFDIIKVRMNERVYLTNIIREMNIPYFIENFDDYLVRFINIVYGYEEGN